ncbi:hypothetical protein R1flu_000218 [Riccia fluitans]|uniref:EF-hand domain-containing protein n=1 Tax=Riccia fluitans TaxID=41844 RepID=A0ABD1Y003_9MARC
MEVISLGKGGGGKNTDSGLTLKDLDRFFEALGIKGNKLQELEEKLPWLKCGKPKAESPAVKEKSFSMTVENRCDQDGKNAASECTRTEDSDLQTSELGRIFRAVDENQDGLICADDLQRFMGRLGQELSQEEAVAMVATVDQNRDGSVGFEEFCNLYDSCLAGGKKVDDDEDEELKEAFRLYDTNNDGYISCKELQAVLLALGLPEGKSLKTCELMIRNVDLDGNGEIDIKEFKKMMSSDSFLR